MLNWLSRGTQLFVKCHSRCCVFPGGSMGKESACGAGHAEDEGSTHRSGRSPGEENGNPLQYSCLGNLMDRGAWWATVPGIIKSQTQLSDLTAASHSRAYGGDRNHLCVIAACVNCDCSMKLKDFCSLEEKL